MKHKVSCKYCGSEHVEERVRIEREHNTRSTGRLTNTIRWCHYFCCDCSRRFIEKRFLQMQGANLSR